MKKTIRHFTTITSTAAATYTPDVTMGPEEISGFSHCDVVCIVGTMTGVTNTAGMSFYFQELFGDDYVTTAQIQNITGTGVGNGVGTGYGAYVATYDPAGSTGVFLTPSSGSNPLLGKGSLKRIVTTASAALSNASVDIYNVFWCDG